ncbi:hypothetical protein FD754_023164 [Muntiacus muntjak]|uniref:DM domain-containing protein n=1 Tax=Muntiacus muntjak TaxID=9888 RepID=A0A5N3UUE3_MUNMU|nr:hypothetical protein FD754_023165 [Muntiacus muntjak]KAB0340399.1 hypothetical protein FD754_023164 [Muntiacus muntjak]
MDRNEMPAMPCCPPDSTTGLETGAPQAIELGPRRSTRRCARCHNHGITDQIKDQEHLCLFEACECHKCIPLSEHYSSLPAERDLKMEQGPYLRRRPTRGRIRRGTTSPRAHGRAKKLGTQARVPIGKENITPQLEAHPYAIPEEESGASTIFQGPLLLGQVVGSLSLSWTPAPLKKQLTISLSRKSHRSLALPTLKRGLAQGLPHHRPLTTNWRGIGVSGKIQKKKKKKKETKTGQAGEGTCYVPAKGINPLISPFLVPRQSTLILQPHATFNPILLQPQTLGRLWGPEPWQGPSLAPEASNQALISAFSEWQQKLEAAKALLALRESSPAPSGSISLLQPCVAPELSTQTPAVCCDLGRTCIGDKPASSISLPIGHLGCVSLLN